MERATPSSRRPTAVSGWLLSASLLTCLLGCGNSDLPPMGRVEGVVTLDGQPLADAVVTLHSVDGNRGARGTTNDQGEFELSTFTLGDGAIAGEHGVAINPKAPPPPAFVFNPRGNHGYTPPFPPRYWSAVESGISTTVEARKTNELNIEMTSE